MEFEALFIQSKGQPIIYKGREIKMIDKLILIDSVIKIKVNLIKTDSVWKQGLIIKTNGTFEVEKKEITNKIVLWEYTAPRETEIIVNSQDKILTVYNVWQTEDGITHYWHNGGAMYIEDKKGKRIYNCNDGFPDDDFSDLIFEICW